jgi:hypothetical protein
MAMKAHSFGWTMRSWGIHIDHPWSECHKLDGAPTRIYIRTPWIFIMFGEKSQVYNRKIKKYTDDWAYLTFRPIKN